MVLKNTHKKKYWVKKWFWYFVRQGKSWKLQCIQWRLTYCTMLNANLRIRQCFNGWQEASTEKNKFTMPLVPNIFNWCSSGYNRSTNKHSKTAIAPGLLRMKRGIIESVAWREEGSTGKYQPQLKEFAEGAIKRIFRECRLLFPSDVYHNPLVLSFDT